MAWLSGLRERRRQRTKLRRALDLLWWEGSFSAAYDAWIGPIYLSGLAGQLGIAVGFVSLFTCAPWLGQVGQIIGTMIYARVPSFKRYTIVVAALARLIWCIPISLAAFWGIKSAFYSQHFPSSTWFFITAFCACIAAILASSSGVGWMSWIGSVIPGKIRGRFFAGKQRFGMIAVILANFLAATWVGWQPKGQKIGYLVLGFLAIFAASISTFLLTKVPDVKRREIKETKNFLEIIKEPLADRSFQKLLIFGALFQGTILFSGPYFAYFFTRELSLSMPTVATWVMLTNLGAFLAAGFWGRKIDKTKDISPLLWVSGHFLALSPLPYALPYVVAIKWIGPFEYFINGVAWSGYSLVMTNLLFRLSPSQNNHSYFSVYAAATGIVGVVAIFLGGFVAQALGAYGGFRALWVLSAMARLLVLWVFGRALLKESYVPVPSLSKA